MSSADLPRYKPGQLMFPKNITLTFPLALCLACGVPAQIDPRGDLESDKDSIVGGDPTLIENYPWQISMQRLSNGRHFCGGSILNDTWILTAAHCVVGTSASSIRVAAGITRQSETNEGQLRNVDEILVFPGYVTVSQGKDAALLKLSSPLDLSTPQAQPINIVTEADAATGLTAPDINSVVSGWGTLSSGGSSPDTLQAVTVPIVSNADAAAAYGSGSITDDQLAAGLLDVGGKDACQGDSGGPLVVPNATGNGWLLAGIVSWGRGCADPDFPGMYARVSSFESWILSNVVVNDPPSTTITAPADGDSVTGDIVVSADASDADGTVDRVRFLFPNGQVIEDADAPYSVTWNSATVGDGVITISALAIDNLDLAGPVASIQVSAENGNDCAGGTVTAADTPIAIPDNNAQGIASSLVMNGEGQVSSFRLSLDIAHTYRGDLVVTLDSPGGTEHIISDRDGGSADNLVLNDVVIDTFAGDNAGGTWTLRISDRAGRDVGTLRSWSIDVTASCGGGGGGGGSGNWSGSATPNLQTQDNGVACDTLTVVPTGDASEVQLDLAGRHDWRSILRGTLSHNGVTVEAFGTGTFPRQGGDFGFTNQAIGGFSGEAAGDWTLCIEDTDAFGDTGVLLNWSVHN